jgi:hypothetical protein
MPHENAAATSGAGQFAPEGLSASDSRGAG